MNDRISWNPSLVKKFSSSNHFKLLNQLRSEVKKYPLNNKKSSSTSQRDDSNEDNKIKPIISKHQNTDYSKYSNHTNGDEGNKSTVSFNNAKNFSIYNSINNNSRLQQTDSKTSVSKKSDSVNISSNIKD